MGEDRAIPEGRHMGRRGGEQLLIGNLYLASLLESDPMAALYSRVIYQAHTTYAQGAHLKEYFGENVDRADFVSRRRACEYIHIYAYIYIYIYIYSYIYRYIYIYFYTCIYVYKCIYIMQHRVMHLNPTSHFHNYLSRLPASLYIYIYIYIYIARAY